MKKLFAISLFALLVFPFSNRALADAGPPGPSYPYIDLNVKIELGNFSDRYLIVKKTYGHGTDYSLAKDEVYLGRDGTSFFAIDKNYVTNNGGFYNLFYTKTSDSEIDRFGEMLPKDAKSFYAYTYDFVLAKNDPLLRSEFEYSEVDDQYIRLPFESDFYNIRKGPDDVNCHFGMNQVCILGKQEFTYVPKQVSGNSMVLVNADTLNQNIQNPAPTPQPQALTPVHIPWYKKLWNLIKSLF